MKKSLLLISSCIFAIILSSCEAVNHQFNIDNINLQHKKCLANAKTDEEREACDARYEQAMDEENTRHENVVNAEKEIDNCEKYQKIVLMEWGYSEAEAKEIAKKLRKCSIVYAKEYRNGDYIDVPYLAQNHPKNTNYSFDCEDAINELLFYGCTDKEGTRVFAEALPKFGLSSSDANQAIKIYYDDGAYANPDNPYHSKNPIDECLEHVRIGGGIIVTKQLLIDLSLLDEDEDKDDSDESDDGDDETPTKPDSTKPDSTKPDSTKPDSTKPDTSISINSGENNANDNYQSEANAISKKVISNYDFNKTNLSYQQKQELEDIIAFMKKWPNAEITIIGHTCNIGSQKNNQFVGKLRAKEVKKYLVGEGISKNRIQTESRDFSNPVVDNDNEEHRKQNRRVTFEIK